MPVYDIRYLHRSGVLASQYSAICEGDRQAKTLAHAMKQPDFKRFEVWDAEMLVYQRPQNPNQSVVRSNIGRYFNFLGVMSFTPNRAERSSRRTNLVYGEEVTRDRLN